MYFSWNILDRAFYKYYLSQSQGDLPLSLTHILHFRKESRKLLQENPWQKIKYFQTIQRNGIFLN